jgi:neurotransmitter:Na+ symporter, NSS family
MSHATSTWKSQGGYIWSLIGSAVGFANILSFSAQVYKNGGGAFLIPYMMALLILGVPMLFLEGMIGYKWKLPLVGAYGKKWGEVGKAIGWLSVIACLTIGAFYIVLTGYSAAYTYFAATDQIPVDSKTFFVESFLKTTSSITNFGVISWPIFLASVVVALVSWFILAREVKNGIERICSWFMPILAMIMTIFAIAVCFLPGGLDGWIYYLKPDFSKLANAGLWRDIFGQLFFSLSLGLGIIVGYSRYTKQETNIGQAMIWVAIGDFTVSFISGAAIFGCLAHISYTQNIPFEAILTTDSTFEIGFILFPQILKTFGPFFSPIIGTIFFFSIFIAGLTGVISIIESIVGNFEIEFRVGRIKAVSIIVTALIALSALFCMGNASHLIDALAPMVLGTNMLIAGILLILAFVYTPSAHPQDCISCIKQEKNFMVFSLRYFAPVILTIILIANLWHESQHLDLAVAIRWSWLIVAIGISTIVVFCSRRVRKLQAHVAILSSSEKKEEINFLSCTNQ